VVSAAQQRPVVSGRFQNTQSALPRLVAQRACQGQDAVSRVYFPQDKKAPTFPRVWRAGTGLWSATSGSSALWTRVSGAGLCLLFSNFRFRGGETGSTAGRDQFEARSREAIAPSESKAQELTAATAATKEPEPPLLLGPGTRAGLWRGR
jgi:hypothetical protein